MLSCQPGTVQHFSPSCSFANLSAELFSLHPESCGVHQLFRKKLFLSCKHTEIEPNHIIWDKDHPKALTTWRGTTRLHLGPEFQLKPVFTYALKIITLTFGLRQNKCYCNSVVILPMNSFCKSHSVIPAVKNAVKSRHKDIS